MLGEDLSRVLSDIDDAKIEAAAKLAPRARNAWRYVAAMAAAVAIVVAAWLLWPEEETPGAQLGTPTEGTTVTPTMPTDNSPQSLPKTYYAAPGILKLYSCSRVNVSQEELENYELTDSVDSYGEVYIPYSNVGGKGISLLFQLPEDYFGEAEITFSVIAEYGGFVNFDTREERKPKVTIKNGTRIWWRAGALSQVEEIVDENEQFYANVIIYADGLVVGYGVISFVFFYEENYAYPSFMAKQFTTVCYPMIDGQFQNVTEEYIWEQIEMCKQFLIDRNEV